MKDSCIRKKVVGELDNRRTVIQKLYISEDFDRINISLLVKENPCSFYAIWVLLFVEDL